MLFANLSVIPQTTVLVGATSKVYNLIGWVLGGGVVEGEHMWI